MSKTSGIEQVPAFDGLTDKELRRIADAGREVNVPANWSVMGESTPADKAYIVLEGELSVRKAKQEIARLGPGDVVGETAIVNHKLRSASVVTLTPVRALHFTREAIEQLSRDIPTFNQALQSAAQGRVVDSENATGPDAPAGS